MGRIIVVGMKFFPRTGLYSNQKKINVNYTVTLCIIVPVGTSCLMVQYDSMKDPALGRSIDVFSPQKTT